MKTTNIKQYLTLTKHLAKREITVRYKQSFLGLFWVILNPFMQMLIMSFVFSYVFKFNMPGVPYPIFMYTGLLPWVYFTTALTSSMGALVDGAGLLKKIYFPREILLLATILAKAFDLSLSLIVLIGMMFYFQIPITWHILLFIPIFIVQTLFVMGLGMFLSVLNLFYRDVQYLVGLGITLLFYLTPILYQVESFPEKYRWIFKFNPMSVFINAYRQILLAHDVPKWESLIVGVGISLLVFILGYKFFKKAEGTFADVV
ncbi:MAG: ABC transporter permease [Patescibacteria group bacterium]